MTNSPFIPRERWSHPEKCPVEPGTRIAFKYFHNSKVEAGETDKPELLNWSRHDPIPILAYRNLGGET